MSEESEAVPASGPDNPKKRGLGLAWILTLVLMGLAAFFLGRTDTARSLMAGGYATEEEADLRSPRLVEAAAFNFRYPGNWILDRTAEDFDPERYLLIESPGGALVIVMVIDGPIDPGPMLEDQIRDFQRGAAMEVETREAFYEWGAIEGRGALLTGRIQGIVPGQVRVFVGRNATRTLLVVSQVDDEDQTLVQPGLKLIRESFVLSEAEGR